ncbi:MAG TPA: hypothetical protein PKW24_07175 [Clostridiales bacterium]|nr:hypothetical protein [Clostridiales bacterium]
MKRFVRSFVGIILVFALILSLGVAGGKPQSLSPSPATSKAGSTLEKLQLTPSEPDGALHAKAVEKSGGDNTHCDCGHNPFIVVPGITDSDVALLDKDGSPVFDKEGKPYVKGGFMLDEDEIINLALKRLAFPLAKTLVAQKDCGLNKAAYETAKEVFWRQATNPDGTPKENLQVIRHEESFANLSDDEINHLFINIPLRDLCDIIGYDHVYYFSFNIVGDPMQTARELDEFIQLVKAQTGHDKVNLLNVSLGASIFTAYAEQFKDKGDVGRIVNIVALLDGSYAFRDLYSDNLNIHDSALYRDLFPEMLEEGGSRKLGYLVNLLIRIFPKQVLLDLVENIRLGAMDSMLRCAPNFWAMMPRDNYEELADKWLSDPIYAECRQKTDAFHRASQNLEANVKYLVEEKGVIINNVCGYGLPFSASTSVFAILGSDKTSNTDGVIHVESTSMGATAAPAGHRLPDDYLAAHAGSRYISPDKGLDASTCTLPDNTWFFLSQDHEEAGKNPACMNLVKELFTNPDFNDVYADPARFPQFNYGADCKEIRRFLLPDTAKALEKYEAGELNIGAEDLAELYAARAQAEQALEMTIGNRQDGAAATKRLKDILIKIGYRQAPEPKKEDSPAKVFFELLLERLLEAANDFVYDLVGGQGYSDKLRSMLK